MNIRKPLFAALALVWLMMPVLAQTHRDPANPNTGTVIVGVAPLWKYTPLGHQVLTSGMLAGATSLTVPAGATIAQIGLEGTGSIRYWDDGSVPTTTSGMLITAPFAGWQYAGALTAIQFIAASGSPQIDIIYYYAP
jgi:hypothetical protein